MIFVAIATGILDARHAYFEYIIVFRSLMLACMIDDQPYLQEDRHFGRAGITSWLSQQQDGPDDD